MSEAEVLYSDVKFTRAKGNASGTASSSDEITYSEVRNSKPQPSSELCGSGSKVTTERVAVVVLSALLAAAVIALGVTAYKNIQTMENLRKLEGEHEALRKNFTDGHSRKCEEGWEEHGGKCYYFSIDKSTWNESREKCKRQGGDLVQIDSRDEQSYLVWKLTGKMIHHDDRFWIGLTDSEKEGTWLWVDGSSLNANLTFWRRSQPDNGLKEDPDGQNCVRMGDKTLNMKSWFDKSCKVPHKHICEKQMSK